MRHRLRFAAMAVTLAACSTPLLAQDNPLLERLRAASRMPQAADEARRTSGDNEVGTLFDIFRERRVPADEAVLVVEEYRRTRQEHGQVENFGAFVRSQLDRGLRGRELAEAIRQEHAARGRGPEARGRPGEAGREQPGRPERGRPENPPRGRPDQR